MGCPLPGSAERRLGTVGGCKDVFARRVPGGRTALPGAGVLHLAPGYLSNWKLTWMTRSSYGLRTRYFWPASRKR